MRSRSRATSCYTSGSLRHPRSDGSPPAVFGVTNRCCSVNGGVRNENAVFQGGTTLQARGMLERGYFPREMPPAFSSKDFGEVASRLSAKAPVKQWTKPVGMNLARPGSLRRRLSIPNPFSQLALVDACHEGWATLESHLKQSDISLSKPVLNRTGSGRAFDVQFGERARARLTRMWRGRFTVRADVTDYYASVYTHSLEWALHTKSFAKLNLKSRGPQLLGAKLDAAVRNGQDGQTKGIPVGPDTSLLLGELIMCEIDKSVQSLMPQARTSAIRLMDDMEFFAQTRAEADEFLTMWDSLLHEYDLSLNPSKTEVLEGPIPPQAPWRVTLSQFHFRTENDSLLANDIQSFFARAFDLVRGNPGDPVLSYAVSTAGRLRTGTKSWAALQYAMLAAVTTEPSTLQFVYPILAKARRTGAGIDRALVEETLNHLSSYHAPFEHGSQVAWSLQTLRMLGLSLDGESAALVAKMRDNSSLIFLMDFINRGKIAGEVPDMTAVHERAEDPSACSSEDWLLGYEAGRNGWTNAGNYLAEPHWKELLDIGVEFFHSGASASSESTVPVRTPDPARNNLTRDSPFPPPPEFPSPATSPPTGLEGKEEDEDFTDDVDPAEFY